MSRVIRQQDMFAQGLDLERRVAELENVSRLRAAAYGVWLATSGDATTGGQGSVWGTERRAAPDHVIRGTREVANDCIVILRSGLWMIVASVLTGASGTGRKDVTLYGPSDLVLDRSLGPATADGFSKHKMFATDVFETDNKIYVHTNDVVYAAGEWSMLTAVYLGP